MRLKIISVAPRSSAALVRSQLRQEGGRLGSQDITGGSMLLSVLLLVCFVQMLAVSPDLNSSAAARTGLQRIVFYLRHLWGQYFSMPAHKIMDILW